MHLVLILIVYALLLVDVQGRAGTRSKALAQVASYPYAPKYWWWFIVNYARQLLIILFTVYEPRIRVSEPFVCSATVSQTSAYVYV